MGSQAPQDLKVMGPWVPMLVIMVLYLVIGIMAVAGLAFSVIDFGLPVVVMLAVVPGALGLAAFLFRQRHSAAGL